MNAIIVKHAVEFINGCFIEHNENTQTGTWFYTVKYPNGLVLDYKSLKNARMTCEKGF